MQQSPALSARCGAFGCTLTVSNDSAASLAQARWRLMTCIIRRALLRHCTSTAWLTSAEHQTEAALQGDQLIATSGYTYERETSYQSVNVRSGEHMVRLNTRGEVRGKALSFVCTAQSHSHQTCLAACLHRGFSWLFTY